MKLSDNLKEARKKAKITQVNLAKMCNVSQGTIANWESGTRTPDPETLAKLAEILSVSTDYLIGIDKPTDALELLMSQHNNIKPVRLKRFPLLGEISCGKPIFADEDKESYVMADMDIHADFCLLAKGDSMTGARIYDGDIVFIKEMPLVENGDIAAVIIDNEATLKRVYYYPDKSKLILNPENPAFEPLVYVGDELNDIRILGKAVYFMSAL